MLNRNNREQIKCVTYIEGDRHFIGDKLKEHHFDVIFDMTAYTEEDINGLLDGLGNFD